ncbi:MAG: VanW family protein [Anaerolineales bacterium]|nr:VanW family protein [Anaerolineales bacterium]
MNTSMARRPTPSFLPEPLPQLLAAFAGGVAVFLFLIAASVAAFSFTHAGKIYPGVSMGGVDLSNLTSDQAATRLAEQLSYPQHGRIVLQDGEQVWVVEPVKLGLHLDPTNSAQAAYLYGRQGGLFGRWLDQLRAWRSGYGVAPLFVYDESLARQYLDSLVAQIDRPTLEASLGVEGVEVVAIPGQVGRSLDVPASLKRLEAQLRSMTDGLVPLVVREMPPLILDASAQAETARRILSEPLTLRLPQPQAGDPPPWRIERDVLAKMLVIQRLDSGGNGEYRVGLDLAQMRTFLQEFAPQIDQNPENARFIFNDETRQLEVIQPAVTGRVLNIEGSLQKINQKLAEGEHDLTLEVTFAPPQVGDDATGEKLGITELVSAETSYFYGSSTDRIQNIQTAAARFHGVLVPPGATFSMAEVLGDVSLDNGYAEALIIFGNRTIKGVGGGVCQVSTTLFRTAFFGGFPIVERHPHAYRVTYYELNRAGNANTDLAGLDATVFVPVVDFKFTNDTPYWLLMETYVNAAARSLTWKFYSTSDGRTVEWDTTGLQNIVEPEEPIFQENPELDENEVKQVDWEVEGADVTVTRTVMRDGQVYLQDQFYTHYMPWRAVYEYGPGTKVIKLKKLLLQP